jgi:hypothetical protein
MAVEAELARICCVQRNAENHATGGAKCGLNGMHYEFRNANCNLGYDTPADVYTFALVWHGVIVETYVITSATCYWDVTTLGVLTCYPVWALTHF